MATNPVKKVKSKLEKETKGSGRRFGEEKPVQRNKESMPDEKPNRSPGESNANRWGASVKEDVVKSQKTDIERMRKALSGETKEGLTENQKNFGRLQTKAAAVRGALRTGSRLAYLGGAAGAGYAAGDTARQLYENAQEGRERRRMQEEYEKELDKQQELINKEDVVGLRKGGMVKKMAKGGEVKKKTEAKKPTPVFDKKMKPEDMPPNKAAMDMMREWEDKEKRRKMGERYEQIMPPAGLAKGGAVQQAKVGKVMKEFKEGTLHSGAGGKVVKSPRQAIAIALSEARRMKKK
jgi:hypothetical protein